MADLDFDAVERLMEEGGAGGEKKTSSKPRGERGGDGLRRSLGSVSRERSPDDGMRSSRRRRSPHARDSGASPPGRPLRRSSSRRRASPNEGGSSLREVNGCCRSSSRGRREGYSSSQRDSRGERRGLEQSASSATRLAPVSSGGSGRGASSARPSSPPAGGSHRNGRRDDPWLSGSSRRGGRPYASGGDGAIPHHRDRGWEASTGGLRGGGSSGDWRSSRRDGRGGGRPLSPSDRRRSRSRDRGRRPAPGHSSGGGGNGGSGRGSSPAARRALPPTDNTAQRLGPKDELLRRQREEEQRRKEIEEARRDDLTVLVLNLSLKADERHIYEFFSQNAGKIRDIQQIRDQRSGVSKGVAYVEFYTQEAVIKAMALNGICFKGQPLRVQASMAEKNRAARAAKCPIQQTPDASSLQIPMRVYVGGLIGPLAQLSEDDLRALFAPFGEISEVLLPKDANTGESVGFAFVVFSSAADAHEAMQRMHNFQIAGQQLRVGYAADGVRMSNSEIEIAPAGAGAGMGMAGAGGLGLAGGAASGAGVGVPAHVVAATQVSQEALLAQQLAAQAASMMKQQRGGQAAGGGGPQQQQQFDGGDDEGLDDEDGGYIHDPARKQALMQKLLSRGGGSSTDAARSEAPGGNAASPEGADQKFLKSSGTRTTGMLAPGVITSCLMLANMFRPSDAEAGDEFFFQDIKEDVAEECGKHGAVVEVLLNEKDAEGRVWVKFNAPSVALAAQQSLNGRFFGGKKIQAEFATEAMIQSVCQK